MPGRNSRLGSNVTLTGASCQLDPAMIFMDMRYGGGSSAAEADEVDRVVMLRKYFESSWKMRLFRTEARDRNK
uniref:Uncharacterized protein n=1 Tax=Romanomermis culicivorax TaxID=13658 RepID=A0A915HQD7_ROMCU